jgi:rhodanese-related sulfurtransferase
MALIRRLSASALLAFFSCRRAPSDWETTKSWVRSEFPRVEHVSAEELKSSLDVAPNRKAPILLDVRTAKEYEVSHLPGAIRVDPDSELPDFLKTLDRDSPVVAYCSVGYRSSRLVDRLDREGFTNARNLEGSIFEWANKGYPVERDGVQVQEVHPYDEEWGRLLAPSLRTYEPRAQPPR